MHTRSLLVLHRTSQIRNKKNTLLFLSPLYFLFTLNRLGVAVGKRPYHTIIICLVVFALCMIGILRFTRESRGPKLWVNPDASVLDDKDWVEENFPSKFLFVNYIGIRSFQGSQAGALEASSVKQVQCSRCGLSLRHSIKMAALYTMWNMHDYFSLSKKKKEIGGGGKYD